MTEKPIVFSGPMVRAILDGRKSQTRRVLKPQPPVYMSSLRPWFQNPSIWIDADGTNYEVRCPFSVGQMLWVREMWAVPSSESIGGKTFPIEDVAYAADALSCDLENVAIHWRPSIHMPRWASRITLEITDVRVQRVQRITNDDAQAEGVVPIAWLGNAQLNDYRVPFIRLWDSLNAKHGHGWDTNPWVWAISFKLITKAAKDVAVHQEAQGRRHLGPLPSMRRLGVLPR